MTTRPRSSLSFSNTFFRFGTGSTSNTHNPHQPSGAPSVSALAAAAAAATHAAMQSPFHNIVTAADAYHDIDYSFRFPYPDNEQKEYFHPHDYVDADVRHRQERENRKAEKAASTTGPSSSSSSSTTTPPLLDFFRVRDRLRTSCVALIACLNIGVDPPDVIRPDHSSRVECWVDPVGMAAQKALRLIGSKLQNQYERWQEKIQYKLLLDPTADELRKTLVQLRRQTNEDRVLCHYNGHGVPKPTTNGEIWVYNKGYTQYIPVSIYDVQSWLGGVESAMVMIVDCHAAGIVIEAFQHFMQQRKDKARATLRQQQQQQHQRNQGGNGGGSDLHADSARFLAMLNDPCRHILLAPCSSTQLLPMTPDLPADLFTACLTTPIKMALRWFVLRSSVLNGATTPSSPAATSNAANASPPSSPSQRARLLDLIDHLPGSKKPNNRKLLFGELNWIFTAITDSIAWNCLDRVLFQKLFRQDLLVASLFRNYLLAERILYCYGCTAQSVPSLPSTHSHPLWSCWDLVADIALNQFDRHESHGTPLHPSTFFEDQLAAFELWLEFGSATRPPPMQLPIVLQVLLSNDHRLRALHLLARFCDKGNWAVTLALSVGVYPYVLKLLQSPSRELREVLVFIWARILALDRTSVGSDMTKGDHASYFVQHLKITTIQAINAMSGVQSSGHGLGRGMSRASASPSPSMRPLSVPSSTYLGAQSNPSTPFHSFLAPAVSAAANSSGASPYASLPQRSTNPPPLHLPPSSSSSSNATERTPQGRDGGGLANGDSSSRSKHSHVRAVPFHDPAAWKPAYQQQSRFHHQHHVDAEAGQPVPPAAQPVIGPTFPSAPLRSPTLSMESRNRSSVSLSLDVSTVVSTSSTSGSPLPSPTSAGPAGRPSPHLSGFTFSPGHGSPPPMLSPHLHRHTPESAVSAHSIRTMDDVRQGQTQAQQRSGEGSSDAQDLTRIARESLATPALQHLLTIFILTCMAHGTGTSVTKEGEGNKGQQILLSSGGGLSLRDLSSPHLLHARNPLLRRWSCLLLGKVWHGFNRAKDLAVAEGVLNKLTEVLTDPMAQVRCAALYALASFFGGKSGGTSMAGPQLLGSATNSTSSSSTSSPAFTPVFISSRSSAGSGSNSAVPLHRDRARLDLELSLGQSMSLLINDSSPLVRRELLIALAELIYFHQGLFLAVLECAPKSRQKSFPHAWAVWRALQRGMKDVVREVADVALAIDAYLRGRAMLNRSVLGRMIGSGAQAQYYGYTDAQNNDQTASKQDPSSSAQNDSQRTGNEEKQQSNGVRPLSQLPPPSSKQQYPPLRHFNRHKLSHLRSAGLAPGASIGPGASGAATMGPGMGMGLGLGGAAVSAAGSGASSAAQRRTMEKSATLKPMDSSNMADGSSGATGPDGEPLLPAPIDERAGDQLWQVPKSRLFEESYQQFSHQTMLTPANNNDECEQDLSVIREKKWRAARRETLHSHAWTLRSTPPAKNSFVEVMFLDAEWECTSCIHFHPYERMMFASDGKSKIGVWNYSPDQEAGKERINLFSNDNPPGTHVTQLDIINEQQVSLLLVASDDGIVRVWRNVHEEGRQRLVTAWNANPMPEMMYTATGNNTTVGPGDGPRNTNATDESDQQQPKQAWPAGGEMHGGGEFATFSFQDSSMHAPINRMNASRHNSGVGIGSGVAGVGPVTAVSAMRHSASTPALQAQDIRNLSLTVSHSPDMRPTQVGNGSSTSVPHSPAPSSFAQPIPNHATESPSLKPVQTSPILASTSSSLQVPSFSLPGGSTPLTSTSAQQQPQRRLSASNASPSVSGAQSTAQVWPYTAHHLLSSSSSSRRRQRPPLVVEWQQDTGRLLASGNGLELIRVWNVDYEQCVAELPLHGASTLEPHMAAYVTSMTSDGRELAWAGCTDGMLRGFDLRIPPIHSLVSTANLHRSPVQNVHLQRRGEDAGMLISASIGGDIALADVRMVDSAVVRYHRSSHKDKSSYLSSFAVHDFAPLMASGSPKPFIEVFDHTGMTIDTIRYHVGFLGQRIGPVNALTFHRHKLLLAAGSLDHYISIFAADKHW